MKCYLCGKNATQVPFENTIEDSKKIVDKNCKNKDEDFKHLLTGITALMASGPYGQWECKHCNKPLNTMELIGKNLCSVQPMPTPNVEKIYKWPLQWIKDTLPENNDEYYLTYQRSYAIAQFKDNEWQTNANVKYWMPLPLKQTMKSANDPPTEDGLYLTYYRANSEHGNIENYSLTLFEQFVGWKEYQSNTLLWIELPNRPE